MSVPGTVVGLLSVFVIDRSATAVTVSVSEPVLFELSGSVTSAGGTTLAEFVSDPTAAGSIVAVSVNVTEPAGATVTVVLISPVPLAEPQTFGAVAAQLHVGSISVAGTRSVTVAPTAADTPELLTTIVYVTAVPGCADATPSVLVTERSAVAVTSVVSVAELFVDAGSVTVAGTVTVAVLLNVPRKNGSIVPVTAIVTEPPAPTSTVVFGLAAPGRRRAVRRGICDTRPRRVGEPRRQRIGHGRAGDGRRPGVRHDDRVGGGVAGDRIRESVGLGD